jgi:AraC-like DNA-binding protein
MLNPTLSCSGRIVRPFLSVLARYPGLSEEVALARARTFEPRIAIESVQDLIEHWVRVTLDPDLGLRAGQATCIGTGGALDYALHTAHTLHASILLAQRFAKLYSDDLEITMVTDRERTSIHFGSLHPTPRALTDFVLATWYRNHLQPHLGLDSQLECSFSYSTPNSVEVHRSVFGTAQLTFDAAFDGFSFDSRALDRSLESADWSLHELHCEQLELIDTPAVQQSVAMRVRRALAAELRQGRPSSITLARKLRMSRRTLVRRLAREGTSFSALLDDLRRQLALHLVLKGRWSLDEMSRSLGFTHVQAFHRSFKRWTGSTPTRYRETNARGPAAA